MCACCIPCLYQDMRAFVASKSKLQQHSQPYRCPFFAPPTHGARRTPLRLTAGDPVHTSAASSASCLLVVQPTTGPTLRRPSWVLQRRATSQPLTGSRQAWAVTRRHAVLPRRCTQCEWWQRGVALSGRPAPRLHPPIPLHSSCSSRAPLPCTDTHFSHNPLSTSPFPPFSSPPFRAAHSPPIRSDQQPRRPTNLPAGTTSLSDRIAALQKKGSSNGSASSGASRSTSVNVNSSSTGSSTTPGQLGPGGIPTRSLSSGSQAVKDRIAKFQNHEKPLLPKSSFGAPSPMGPEKYANVHRPYPGVSASGGGSGQWGEGVLRPQLTGGTWVGGGEGRGWAEAGGVRPQLTGGAWLGGGSGANPGGSQRMKGEGARMSDCHLSSH